MASDAELTDGPSARAATLARGWLLFLGISTLLAGIATQLTDGGAFWNLTTGFVVVGLLFALAARYLSARLAVLIALFGG